MIKALIQTERGRNQILFDQLAALPTLGMPVDSFLVSASTLKLAPYTCPELPTLGTGLTSLSGCSKLLNPPDVVKKNPEHGDQICYHWCPIWNKRNCKINDYTMVVQKEKKLSVLAQLLFLLTHFQILINLDKFSSDCLFKTNLNITFGEWCKGIPTALSYDLCVVWKNKISIGISSPSKGNIPISILPTTRICISS